MLFRSRSWFGEVDSPGAVGSRPVQSALGLPPVQADQESLERAITSPMIGLSGLRASSVAVASAVDMLSGSVSMMAVTSARSSARSSNELSGALEVGLGGFDSLTVNS